MEQALSIVGLIFAIYLIIKLNKVLTVGIGVVNTVVDLADESTEVYADDVKINLAKKRKDQVEELGAMDFIPTSEDIRSILAGKSATSESSDQPIPSKDQM